MKTIQLAILDEVDKFCRDNGITYFLTFGTLIGAVRHKGFIPWDDDIDIAMPRPDYERFVNNFNRQSNASYYKVIDWLSSPNYGLPFAKVHDSRTVMHEYLYKQDDFGVYIDVFPIDGIERDKRQIPRVSRLVKLLNTKKAVLGRGRALWKDCVIGCGKFLLLPISKKFLIRRIEQIATSVDYDSAKEVACAVSFYSEKDIVRKVAVDKTIDCTFEGKTYKIPEGYDEYLSNIYGDYMKLPPVEKRVTHYLFEAWWK